MSMPGMLESFLNVGINETIAEGMAATPRYAWAAWDSYRRFLQFWGMSHGLGRQLFDELMRDAKERYGVPKKALLAPRGWGSSPCATARCWRSAACGWSRSPSSSCWPAWSACTARGTPSTRASTGARSTSPTSGAPR